MVSFNGPSAGTDSMADDLQLANITRYLDSLVPARPAELEAMENEAARTQFPIIGPASGQLCYLIARLTGAHTVFELGSGFGYSTAWFARAVQENGGGVVHHVVWDSTLSSKARGHLAALGLSDVVQYHEGEAVKTLSGTPGSFDLIFNDIDKVDYPASLPVIKKKLRAGGVLIVDNLLWGGRIFDPEDQAPDTKGVRELTRLITNDAAWTASISPIRDGLLIARLS